MITPPSISASLRRHPKPAIHPKSAIPLPAGTEPNAASPDGQLWIESGRSMHRSGPAKTVPATITSLSFELTPNTAEAESITQWDAAVRQGGTGGAEILAFRHTGGRC